MCKFLILRNLNIFTRENETIIYISMYLSSIYVIYQSIIYLQMYNIDMYY